MTEKSVSINKSTIKTEKITKKEIAECDGIIMDNAKISAIPEITANHLDAELIHEAAIGKIAGEQIVKLMTLGLTEAEAEAQIINGFLK